MKDDVKVMENYSMVIMHDFYFKHCVMFSNLTILIVYIYIVDCMFAIAPSGSPTTYELAAFIRESADKTLILRVYSNTFKDAVVIDKRQNQQIMSSTIDCQLISLEVYRGRQQITEINHSGFSINNGSILVSVLIIFLPPCR